MRDEIVLVAVGNVDEKLLTHLCGAITERFGNPCCLGKAMSDPRYAFEPVRKQYAAEAILSRLAPAKDERMLGVVDHDLYARDLNFVFGLADHVRKRAVIALPRLREDFYGRGRDEAQFVARAEKEAIHELGHTYGLGHCADHTCVMAFSNSLADTDNKRSQFCPQCQVQLQPESRAASSGA